MARVELPPLMTFVTHGESHASDTLRARIQHELGWHVRVPEYLKRVNILALH
jgi:metallo-beta-lactamase family protein